MERVHADKHDNDRIYIISSSASLAHLSFLDHPLPFFHWSSTVSSNRKLESHVSIVDTKKNTRYTSYVQTFKKREFICTYI